MILGNSGCIINVKENTLIKKSFSVEYNHRLYNQMIKQKNFVNFSVFKTPEIYSFEHNTNFEFSMKYINGENFIEYFNNCNILDIIKFINNIEEYFNNFEHKIVFIPVKIIEEKVYKIFDLYYDPFLYNKFEALKCDLNIPIQNCHGDLTLSNILFKNNFIYLIDFLDTFIETPLQDMVKIRQDTKYYYSLILHNNNCSKIKIILNYIDMVLNNYFNKYDYYVKYYRIFQFINFLRIIPYIKNDIIKKYIINILHEI